ncbi:hypothetical protein EI94DRAFT_575260 [Lactarius quietus]|nr:hypothetical protein EI94DRAFT_575260 [Lactarius quietus]
MHPTLRLRVVSNQFRTSLSLNLRNQFYWLLCLIVYWSTTASSNVTSTARDCDCVATTPTYTNEARKAGSITALKPLTPFVNARCDPILFGFLSQLVLVFLAHSALISLLSPPLPDIQYGPSRPLGNLYNLKEPGLPYSNRDRGRTTTNL